MERLTVFDGDFWVHKDFPRVEEDLVDEFIDRVKELAERLAAIEDILGDDYDLDRLRELVGADRGGQCVVLPCKPGDTIWSVDSGGVSSHAIRRLERNKDGDYACSMLMFPLEDFGKKVFLTRESAEAALAKTKGKQDDL